MSIEVFVVEVETCLLSARPTIQAIQMKKPHHPKEIVESKNFSSGLQCFEPKRFDSPITRTKDPALMLTRLGKMSSENWMRPVSACQDNEDCRKPDASALGVCGDEQIERNRRL